MKFRFLLFTMFLLATSTVYSDEPFRVGTAEIEITPPIGYRMSGYFYERLNEGIKDPLKAKAIVFSQGNSTGAIIVCDIIGIFLEVSIPARKLIEENLSIPASHISIAATHAHTGPLYSGSMRNQFHSEAIARDGSDPHEKIDYPKFLIKQIVEVTKQAKNNLQQVNISAGFGFENRIAFNRRFVMKSGKVRTWIGINHPDVVRVAGPIDTEIGLVQFTSVKNKQPVSLISSYALHLDTVGGTKFSADFPYYLSKSLKEKFGEQFTSLFGAGTCGDINHVNTKTKKRNKTNEIGNYLTESVLKALPDLKPASKPSLKIKSAIVNAGKQQYTEAEITEAKTITPRINDSKIPFNKRVKSYSIVNLQENKNSTLPFEVHVFQISKDVAIVTLPGEVFVELGMQIKQESPFKTTLVIELANEAPGYIPTKKAFAEGSYETLNSRCVPGSGEEMTSVAIQLLKELHAE